MAEPLYIDKNTPRISLDDDLEEEFAALESQVRQPVSDTTALDEASEAELAELQENLRPPDQHSLDFVPDLDLSELSILLNDERTLESEYPETPELVIDENTRRVEDIPELVIDSDTPRISLDDDLPAHDDASPVPLDELSEGELAELESIVRENPPEEPSQLTEYDPSIHREPAVTPDDMEQVHIQDTVEPGTVKKSWLEFTQGSLPERPRVQDEVQVTDGVIRRDGDIVGEMPMEETLTDPEFLAEGAMYAAAIPTGAIAVPGALRVVGAAKSAEAVSRFLVPVLVTSPSWELGSMLTGGVLDLSRLGFQVTRAGLRGAIRGAGNLADAGSSQRMILDGLDKSLDDLRVGDTDPLTGKELSYLSKTADDLARATDELPRRVDYGEAPRSHTLPPDEHFIPREARLQDELPRPFGGPRQIPKHLSPDEDLMYQQLYREMGDGEPVPTHGLHDPDFPPEGTLRYGDDPLHSPEMGTNIGGERVTLDGPGMQAHQGHAATTEYMPGIREDFMGWFKGKINRAGRTIQEEGIDREAGFKRKFTHLGNEGKDITSTIVRSHGASAEAWRQFTDEGAATFFSSLKKHDNRFLSEMLEASGKEHEAENVINWSRELRDELPSSPIVRLDFFDRFINESSFKHAVNSNPKLKTRYEKLSTEYNELINGQVQQLRNEGIPLAGDEGLPIDFTRMTPEEMLHTLDPVHEYRAGMKTHVVHESGERPLGPAQMRALAADPEKLLMTVYNRVQGRIFRNRANQSMLDLTRTAKNNTDTMINAQDIRKLVFELDEGAPQLMGRDYLPGYTEIPVYHDGRKIRMMMKEEAAEMWAMNDPVMNAATAHTLKNISLVSPLQAAKTGMNPLWSVFRGLPKDISYTFINYKGYRRSKTVFHAAAKLASDMAAVAKDVWKHEGVYKAFFKEGGGQIGMYHADSTRGVGKKLAKIGEFCENWVRLAVRHREITKLHKAPEEATRVARELLDFNQAGRSTQVASKFFAYINPMIQGTRNTAKTWMKDPAGAAFMTCQIAAIQWSARAAAFSLGIDFLANQYDRDNGINIPMFKYRDQTDQERWAYFKIPLDEAQTTISATVNEVVESIIEGRSLELGRIWKNIEYMISFDQASLSMPLIQAYTMLQNVSLFFMDTVVRGQPVELPSEYDQKTPGLYKALGGLGLSPDRTEAAVESVVGGHFVYQFIEDFGSLLTNVAMGKKPGGKVLYDYMADYLPYVLRSTPVGHVGLYEEHDKVERKHNTIRMEQRRSFNDSVKQYQNNPTSANRASVMENIRDLPYEKRKAALRQFKDRIRITKRVGPNESSYMGFVASKHNEEQADTFLVRYDRSSEEMRRKLEKHARRMGWFQDPEFNRRFYEMKKRK